MGLLSFIGKVAKTGLSLATGGKSDAVLKTLGKVTGLGGKPKPKTATAVPDQQPTIQDRAFLNKAIEYTPKVQRTESSVEGWGFGKARGGFKRKRAAKTKRRPSVAAAPAPKATKKAPRSPAAARTPRKAPSGGLDLKAIGKAWAAAGKGPGTGMTWTQFRAANSHLRVK